MNTTPIWVVTKEVGFNNEEKEVEFVKAYTDHAKAEHVRFELEKNNTHLWTNFYVNAVDLES